MLIKNFLNDDLSIFPCNFDKTPNLKHWNKINPNTSKNMYSLNQCDNTYTSTNIHNYHTQNIGMLCGKQSQVIVIDIDIKDNGMCYWNELLAEHNLTDI